MKHSIIFLLRCQITVIHLHTQKEEIVLVVECCTWLISDVSEQSSVLAWIWVEKTKIHLFETSVPSVLKLKDICQTDICQTKGWILNVLPFGVEDPFPFKTKIFLGTQLTDSP